MSDKDLQQEIPPIGIYSGTRNSVGQRHGSAECHFPNGDVFTGVYVDGVRCGKGTYHWNKDAGGAVYSGDYVGGERNGNGVLVYPDGSRYVGEFVGGKRQGNGVYVYANGDVYKGEWKENLKNGNGVYYCVGGGKRQGVWLNGMLSGEGKVIYLDVEVKGTWGEENALTGQVQYVRAE